MAMESLSELLKNIELISLKDLSEVPIKNQHCVAQRLEQLQDELKSAMTNKLQEA